MGDVTVMFEITDIHNHSLFGLDDGANSYETMCRMLEQSYYSGVRCVCFTPHFLNMGENDCTPEKLRAVFDKASEHCAKYMPDLRLFYGMEISYHFDCVDALADGTALTIANSRYVLVDFFSTNDARGIRVGVERLINRGYIPIIAHVERYPCLWGRIEDIRRLSMMGAVIQINVGSLFDGLMSKRRRLCMKLLSEGVVDVVASDAHNTSSRSPELKKAAELLISKFGYAYAEQLLSENPKKIISDTRL